MPTFIMLARLNPDALPQGGQLERDAMKRVREECPNVEWLNSYVVLGPCDTTSSLPMTSRRPLGYPRCDSPRCHRSHNSVFSAAVKPR